MLCAVLCIKRAGSGLSALEKNDKYEFLRSDLKSICILHTMINSDYHIINNISFVLIGLMHTSYNVVSS